MNWRMLGVGVAVISAGFVPAIPQEMELLHCYQTTPQAIVESIKFAEANRGREAELSVMDRMKLTPLPVLLDGDANGIVSACVFSDRHGNDVHIQIPDSQYSDMGLPKEWGKGVLSNPTKDEYISIFEAITPEVSAAVAHDNSTCSTFQTGVSSVTYAKTNTGSNITLLMAAYADGADLVTGITYNAVAGTFIAKRERPIDSGYSYMYYLINPATGANNVVISTSANTGIIGCAASYTGTNQSTQPDNSGTNAGKPVSELYATLTPNSDGTFVVFAALLDNDSIAAGTATTMRASGSSVFAIGDSGGVVSPAAATTIGYTGGANSGSTGVIVSVGAPAAAPATPKDGQVIIRNGKLEIRTQATIK